MKGDVASASSMITTISSIFVILAIGSVLASIIFRDKYWVLIVAALLAILVLWTYFRAPVAYQVSGDTLVVQLRLGSKRFGPVASYAPVTEPVSFAIRLWGNGGLFAVTGWYRNQTYGVFQAYVTNPNTPHLVLVETTDGKKIVISPANAAAWVSDPRG